MLTKKLPPPEDFRPQDQTPRMGLPPPLPCITAAVHAPKVKNTLAERILTETQVYRLISLEPSPRNRALLLLTYALGGRLSEVCGLKWRDMQEREVEGQTAGQVTVYGKGGKTRIVLLSPDTWRELMVLRFDAGPDSPVFPSRKGRGHLHPVQVDRIIKAAAKQAGIEAPVSPHWLRHAHASHALDRALRFTWCKPRWAMPR